MISSRQLAALTLVVSACKLLHREEAGEAGAVTSSSATAAATDLAGVSASPSTSASDSASALASAAPSSSSVVDPRQAARLEALREAQEFGMLDLLDAGDIGLGTIGSGTGTSGHLGAHTTHAASLRMGALSVNGRLPPEVITRIVRQNFGRFRLCYQNGLTSNPLLQGRVMVKFVIGHDGSVTTAADGGSDMPDATVTSCVVRACSALSFPQPEGGIVVVSAPIIFSPSS